MAEHKLSQKERESLRDLAARIEKGSTNHVVESPILGAPPVAPGLVKHHLVECFKLGHRVRWYRILLRGAMELGQLPEDYHAAMHELRNVLGSSDGWKNDRRHGFVSAVILLLDSRAAEPHYVWPVLLKWVRHELSHESSRGEVTGALRDWVSRFTTLEEREQDVEWWKKVRREVSNG